MRDVARRYGVGAMSISRLAREPEFQALVAKARERRAPTPEADPRGLPDEARDLQSLAVAYLRAVLADPTQPVGDKAAITCAMGVLRETGLLRPTPAAVPEEMPADLGAALREIGWTAAT